MKVYKNLPVKVLSYNKTN